MNTTVYEIENFFFSKVKGDIQISKPSVIVFKWLKNTQLDCGLVVISVDDL